MFETESMLESRDAFLNGLFVEKGLCCGPLVEVRALAALWILIVGSRSFL
jgi:hypothetical protein